jgi:hypothetical protein
MWTAGVSSTLKSPSEGIRTTCRVPLSLVLAAAVTLVGCATPRPRPPLICSLRAIAPEQPAQTAPAAPTPAPPYPGVTPAPAEPTVRAAVPPELRALRGQIKASFEQRRDRKRALRQPVTPHMGPSRPAPMPAPVPPPTYDILVLSAGGQFGAYGSGFLAGWGERTDLAPNRGDIDMVTGVSTGAMMATYAYLGASFDPVVRAEYHAPHPRSPWRSITALRNVLIHEYFGVDLEIVWRVVQKRLPTLNCHVGVMLSRMPARQPSSR